MYIKKYNQLFVFGRNDKFQLGLGHNEFVSEETLNPDVVFPSRMKSARK